MDEESEYFGLKIIWDQMKDNEDYKDTQFEYIVFIILNILCKILLELIYFTLSTYNLLCWYIYSFMFFSQNRQMSAWSEKKKR